MFKSFVSEFKKFAVRGNVIDMAVGIIIGAAFGKIVDSLVKDILMPPISFFLGKLDFSNLFFVLKDGANLKGSYVSLQQAMDDGAITLNLGNFLNASISFFIADIVSIKTATDLVQAFPIGSYLSGNIVEITHGNIATIDLLGISCKHILLPGMEIGQQIICQIRDFNPKNQDLIVSAIGA